MTQAVLLGMRARGSGYIVNISSVGGRMAAPGSGFYSATKFAVEGLFDALRKEVKPLGIGVMVVEPSGFRTDFAGRSLRQSARTIDAYAPTAGKRRKASVPDELEAAEAAPLLCAGITTFNALRRSGVGPGDLAAILGIAKMGYRTVAIARGSDKEPLARKLGARHYIEGDQNSADDRNHAA